MDQAAVTRPVTKAAWTPQSRGAMLERVISALALCAAPTPGPVQVNLPTDLLEGDWPEGSGVAMPIAPPPLATADMASIERAAALLSEAKKPMIIAGPSANRGALAAALRALGRSADIPYLAAESPRGHAEPRTGPVLAEVVGEADTVVLAAKHLDFILGCGATPPFKNSVQFIALAADMDGLRADRRRAGDHLFQPVIGHPVLTTKALEERLSNVTAGGVTAGRESWGVQVQEALVFTPPPHWRALAAEDATPLHPVTLFGIMQTVIEESGPWTLVSDGGAAHVPSFIVANDVRWNAAEHQI
ncbi:MAG: hypothetical protein GKR94_33580 [Gammaproteobacteria bacterium]|nr:hypothetical protein [Gammaproteobacteria bacterium]